MNAAPVLPDPTHVLIAGGGPVGLAAAVEFGRRGIECVVIEPRDPVSHARPRCKTVNVRSMEHLRRWGIADRLCDRAPLPVAWSQDIVFCTSLVGYELSRFSGVLGLAPEGDRSAETGVQAPQYVLEELLRDFIQELPEVAQGIGRRVTGLEQDDDAVRVTVVDDRGRRSVISAAYVLAATVRAALCARRSVLRTSASARCDRTSGWCSTRRSFWPATSTDRRFSIGSSTGTRVNATVLSHDPWTARMQLVDHARDRRVFLAGDAAHLNPPFGGHGLNTGIGDAVDIGWKLAAVLQGWGGPRLLDSYEAERRPIQTRVISAAAANNRVLATDLLHDDAERPGEVGERARRASHHKIQAAKRAELHPLSLVLDLAYEQSPVIVADGPGPPVTDDDEPVTEARPGAPLPHVRLGADRSIYDELGSGITLLALGDHSLEAFQRAANDRAVPLRIVRQPDTLRDRYRAGLILVRPDQHVAWCADRMPDDPAGVIDRVRGAAPTGGAR